MTTSEVPVTLRSLDGVDNVVRVKLSSNCQTLFTEVERLNAGAQQITLTYAGKKLDPNVPMVKYGITKNSVIFAAYSTAGGEL